MHTLAGALHADFRIPDTSYQTFLRMTISKVIEGNRARMV